ncbi:MAG: DNA cytosine methyltransferase [Planctomycetaceae bacterium]
MKGNPTFLSLFCGCGGMDLGFEQAGFRGIGAFDIDPSAIAVHAHNLPGPSEICDLNLNSPQCPRPSVVIAGPPCQGFSTLGKRNVRDPRNSLLVIAARHAIRIHPTAIVLENVIGAISGKHADYWSTAEGIISGAGYRISTHRVVSSDFGVPQIRRRILMIAWRSKAKEPSLMGTAHGLTLRTALQNVQNLPNHEPKYLREGSADHSIASRIGPHQKLCNVRGGDRAVPTWEIPEVFGRTNSQERKVLVAIQKLRRRLRHRDHGDADPLSISDVSAHVGWDVSEEIRKLTNKGYLRRFGLRFDLAHSFNGKFRRLDWEQVAPAVDTRFGEPRYYLHPDENRGLSVREAARIQGFPDDFVFSGPRAAQFRMVGNAVPPPLAQNVAVMVRDQLL